jgi:hypothetical protein
MVHTNSLLCKRDTSHALSTALASFFSCNTLINVLTRIIIINTIIAIQIEFDPVKDALNIKNHGLSLAAATGIEWDLLVSHTDNTRHDYYEQRMIGFAPIGSEVYCVVFVERSEDVMRVISLRKATKQEVKNYVNHLN